MADDDTDTCRSMGRMRMRAEWTISGKEAVIRAEDALQQIFSGEKNKNNTR